MFGWCLPRTRSSRKIVFRTVTAGSIGYLQIREAPFEFPPDAGRPAGSRIPKHDRIGAGQIYAMAVGMVRENVA